MRFTFSAGRKQRAAAYRDLTNNLSPSIGAGVCGYRISDQADFPVAICAEYARSRTIIGFESVLEAEDFAKRILALADKRRDEEAAKERRQCAPEDATCPNWPGACLCAGAK